MLALRCRCCLHASFLVSLLVWNMQQSLNCLQIISIVTISKWKYFLFTFKFNLGCCSLNSNAGQKAFVLQDGYFQLRANRQVALTQKLLITSKQENELEQQEVELNRKANGVIFLGWLTAFIKLVMVTKSSNGKRSQIMQCLNGFNGRTCWAMSKEIWQTLSLLSLALSTEALVSCWFCIRQVNIVLNEQPPFPGQS